MSKPETSIIIRTFNEGKHIGNLLKAIKEQDCKDYEIIVVDSGSTDDTLKIVKDSGCSTILQIESRDFTFGYSLNAGCRQSRGKYVVFVSAHALPVNRQWLTNLLLSFKNERVAMVYGRQIGTKDSKFSEKRDFQRLFSNSSGYVNNANSAIRRELWRERPFDEYLFGLEDIEWAEYITKKGFSVIYEPKAIIYHIHTEKWPQIFNRYRREAIAAVRLGLRNPPQAQTSFFWLANNLLRDFLASLPNISLGRLEEIIRFRYLQWKGSRQGWYHDRDIDLNRDKYALFYPSQNRAVVIKNKHQAGIEDISLPEMKPGDILIQVNYVGVCRTDLEVYDGSLGYYLQGLARYPIIPGHEFAGTIVQIGQSPIYRERFKVGERVVGECILSRGQNSPRQELGVINYNGAYGQFIIMPGEYLHPIPDGLDLKTACLTEPLAVVLRAIRRVKYRLNPKEEIAIIGAGSIGNLCAQVLSQEGFKVTVFDKNQERLAFLKNEIVTVSQNIRDLARFDLIVEATGAADVLKKVLEESRFDSTLLLLGFPYGNLSYNFEDVVGQEKVIIGSVGGREEDFDEALKLLPLLNILPFTQNVLPLENFKEAWKLQQESKQLKIILKVQKDEKF